MITGMPRIAIAVEDFEASVATFRDKLGMPVVDLSQGSVHSLGAKLAMCVPGGGSNIEIMSPADPSAPLSQSLRRFLDRRGEGLFALMLEAPDPDKEAQALLSRGLNVLPTMAGAGGRDVHPGSTHGVLIRVYPVNSFQQPPDFTQTAQPPGISGIVRVIVAVRDLDDAVDVYGRKLAIAVDGSTAALQGVRSARFKPPSGGTIELVSVDETGSGFGKSIDNFLTNQSSGMYALVLRSDDLEQTAKVLTSRGLKVSLSADSREVLEVDRASTLGTLLRIEAG